MTPPACLLWLLAIQICWIQITRIILITNITINTITINTITGATPITILDMTAVIAGAGIAGTAAGEIPVAEMLVAVADVIRVLLYSKRKRASLILLQECPFYVIALLKRQESLLACDLKTSQHRAGVVVHSKRIHRLRI